MVALVAATALLAAGCGGGGEQPAAPGGGQANGGGGTPPPADALEVTATFGDFPLPEGTPGQGRPAVTIGGKDFAEQNVLNELYTQALRAKGYTIEQAKGIGTTEVIDRAFAANQIQMYPEYTGVVATGTSQANQPTPPTALATYQVVQQFVESQREATLFRQTPFQNVDTIVVTPEYAQEHNLTTVADLNNVAPGGEGIRLAAQASFRTRENGLVGMAQTYGLTGLDANFVGLSAGAQVYEALDGGAADAVDGFSTDPQLLGDTYVQLEDPENVFGSQYVVPIVKQQTAQEQGPEFEATCNWVSSLLSVEAIQQMNQAVAGGQSDADVARTFLEQNGLQ